MQDNQIETLSKAIDSLVQVRKMVGLIGRTPQANDTSTLIQADRNLLRALNLVSSLALGKEWKP